MAQVLKTFIDDLKSQIKTKKQTAKDANLFLAAVIGIYRYALDGPVGGERYRYDIIIYDNTSKMKCLLGSPCNNLVTSGELQTGSLIQFGLQDCALRYDETNISAGSFVVLSNCQVVGSYNSAINANARFVDDNKFPLLTGKGGYFHLWTDDPHFDPSIPSADVLLPSVSSHIARNIKTLKNLAENWKTTNVRPTLALRVLCKSRIHNYSRPDKKSKWPFQAYLEVADASGSCSLVLWTSLCVRLFHSIHEGCVILLSNYKVKRRFQLTQQPHIWQSSLPVCDIELSADIRNPAAELHVLSCSEACRALQVPLPVYSFISRHQLSFLPDDSKCDVVGVVARIFRYQRHPKEGENPTYWLHRWLHIYDGSSARPFFVELYDTSQPEVHNQLRPGSVVVLTQMKLKHDISGSRTEPVFYVTSTNHTQVTIMSAIEVNNPANELLRCVPYVNDIIQWSESAEGQAVVEEEAAVGGHFLYPPLPNEVELYMQHSDPQPKLTPILELKTEMNSMVFREFKRVTIQGFLLHVAFQLHRSLELASGSSGSRRARPVKKERVQRVERRVAQQPFANCETLGTEEPAADFVLRKTDSDNSVLSAMRHINMPLSDYVPGPANAVPLSDLPAFDSAGYLVLTVTGLNAESNTPLVKCVLPVSTTLPSLDLTTVLSGEHTDSVYPAANKRHIDLLLDSARHLAGHRVVFVLDLYRNSSHTEIIINRAYVLDAN